MKNVIFKALLCLIPLAFVACGGDSSSNADEPSEVGGNTTPGKLIPGKCIINSFRGYRTAGCSNFTLNESDSTYTITFTINDGICSGPDVEHLSWTGGNIKLDYKYKYSFHGDTLFTRLVKSDVDAGNEAIEEYYASPIREDTLCAVDVYVSNSHQGIKGTWKYVTSYHESPNIYMNPSMENVMTFMSVSEDAFLLEEVDNPNYSFAKTTLVEKTLMDIYNGDGNLYFINTINVGYLSSMYPYNNPALDIQLVSESANKVVFKVNGKDVIFSNISTDINYFYKTIAKFDLEYAGQKCEFYDGFEKVSKNTCKAENAEILELDYEYDENDYSTVLGVEANFYGYGPAGHPFQDCLRKMLGDENE